MAERGTAEVPILITPKTLVTIIGAVSVATIASYMWIFATFVTATAFDAHANDFQTHIEATTVWQLETRLEDITDQRWMLQQRMLQPGGSTADNRRRDHDLEKRESKIFNQITCIKQEGNHCLAQPEGR